MQILVVDDTKSACVMFVALLKAIGYKDSDYTLSGEEALRIVNKFKPKVIFLDIMMPGLSGLDTLSKLRKQGFAGKVFILTGSEDKEMKQFCLTNGADQYLIKGDDIISTNLKKLIEGHK